MYLNAFFSIIILVESCNVLNNCGTFADCVFTKNTFNNDVYMCKCKEGYTGNGYICYKTIIDEVSITSNPLNVIYRPRKFKKCIIKYF